MATETYRYEKQHGSYYLLERLPSGRDEIISMSDSVAILLDVEEGCMMKHGSPELVRKKHSKYVAAGMEDSYVLIESDKWNVADLNRFLGNAHAAGAWYRAMMAETAPSAALPSA